MDLAGEIRSKRGQASGVVKNSRARRRSKEGFYGERKGIFKNAEKGGPGILLDPKESSQIKDSRREDRVDDTGKGDEGGGGF